MSFFLCHFKLDDLYCQLYTNRKYQTVRSYFECFTTNTAVFKINLLFKCRLICSDASDTIVTAQSYIRPILTSGSLNTLNFFNCCRFNRLPFDIRICFCIWNKEATRGSWREECNMS